MNFMESMAVKDKDALDYFEQMKILFESGDYNDVTFSVENKSIGAHKAIVAARSEFLSNLIDGMSSLYIHAIHKQNQNA